MEEEGGRSKRRLQLDQVVENDGEDDLLDDEEGFCSDVGFEEDDGAGDTDDEEVGEDAEEGDECGEDYELVDDYDESLDAGDELNEELFMENDDDLDDYKSEDFIVGEEDIVDVRNTYGHEDVLTGVGHGDGGGFGVDLLYRSYGEQQGFGVVCMGGNRSLGKDNENGKSNSRTYVWRCECHGRPNYRRKVNGKIVTCVEEPIVKRKTKKYGSPVMLYGARKENIWVVKTVVNEHVNHIPTPSKSNHISMFRVKRITQTLLKQMENDHDSGAPVAQIFNNLAGRRNGVENIGFTKKDMHNILNKRMRLRIRDGDAVAMINYLDKTTKDNQNFFHLHRLDKTVKFKDVMWVDARSRAAYQYFGDVVCFDSTYLTNKYELPFSNFIGVNHHG
ncbi:protein FAR1-RELATED SEQUENCE 5-like [Spinacia oleracea]|uniref:Protein FAR1-RELATED SEQUENCE 5-like n=1 Tax=Spinacia oleracea TaxID=3562 RepID=A0ABM3QQK4_SPIOL|nr:protein FAR1-RELATED SEQUENCE 5-like [Spinacia oleracea]